MHNIVRKSKIEEKPFFDCPATVYVYPNTYAATWCRSNNYPCVYFSSTEGDFSYTILDDGSASVTGYTGEGGMVVVPATIGGAAVTDIAAGAFRNNGVVTSVVIPEGVLSIGDGAFSGCSVLSYISVPTSVTNIGANIFGENGNITVSAAEDSSIAQWCIVNEVRFVPVGTENLDYDTDDNGNITITSYTGSDRTFVIPAVICGKPVTGIASGAFDWVETLKEVYIPASVTSIATNAFNVCERLATLTVDEVNPAYTTYDGILYSKDMTSLIYCPCAKTGSVTIPDGVTSIAERAFYFSALSAVYMPDSVTAIGNYAFDDANITELRLSAGLTVIPESAFTFNNYLKKVTIPASVTTIEDSAFSDCYDLAQVVFESGSALETIGDYAFANARFAELTLPSTIRTLEGWCFHACTALTEITLPEGLTTMKDDVFSRSGLTSITLPNSLTSMRNGCFSRCYNLAEVNLGNGLTWLDEGVFWESSSLKSIIIPDCVTEIYDNCFYYSAIEEITIPASVTSFRYDSSFAGCNNLRTLYTTPGSYADNFFREHFPDVTINYLGIVG